MVQSSTSYQQFEEKLKSYLQSLTDNNSPLLTEEEITKITEEFKRSHYKSIEGMSLDDFEDIARHFLSYEELFQE